MYEEFFKLKRRPFSATPDAQCWFHSDRYQAALDELLVCAEQGQGIGVVIAPAGAGKTLLCERLVRDIGEPFTSVLLRHATYQNRRAFLQTLLSELAQPFDKPTDQELRLALAPVLRGLGQQGRALLLVIDEAHTLSESLLEELRILADQAEEGRPLVRLVLCGQLELEEKLARPALQALNQRIRAHVSLVPLGAAESIDYIDYRMTWAGGRTIEVFSPGALDLICQAADGIPRCLNQLCDHSLLLAYVADEQPVSERTVQQALEDLQHLPLSWQMSPRTHRSGDFAAAETIELDFTQPSSPSLNEGPDDLPQNESSAAVGQSVDEISDDDESDIQLHPNAASLAAEWDDDRLSDSTPGTNPQGGADEWQEEVVTDRYASLDAGLPLPETPPPAVIRGDESSVLPPSSNLFHFGSSHEWDPSAPIDARLDALQNMLEYVVDGDAPSDQEAISSSPSVIEFGSDSGRNLQQTAEESLHAPTPSDPHSSEAGKGEGPQSPDAWSESPKLWETQAFEVGGGATTQTRPVTTEETPGPVRPLKNLFTLLRRKQQGRL